jgi:RHS repeat-associated protein
MSVYQLGSGHSLYDAWNRMVCVHADSGTAGRTLDGGDALVATYQYDGRNRRVAKLLPATGGNFKRTDYYYNENWQVLEERYIASVSGTATAATAASRKMLWDARYIDAPVWQWAASACYYYTTDANMNVTTWVLSGGTGPYVRYEYDPYGLPRQLDAGTWNRTSSADVSKTETLYCGYRYDPETGLLQARERYYHPTLGRWGQWDRSGYKRTVSLIEYVQSAPTNHIDPTGEEIFVQEQEYPYSSIPVVAVPDGAWVVPSNPSEQKPTVVKAYSAYFDLTPSTPADVAAFFRRNFGCSCKIELRNTTVKASSAIEAFGVTHAKLVLHYGSELAGFSKKTVVEFGPQYMDEHGDIHPKYWLYSRLDTHYTTVDWGKLIQVHYSDDGELQATYSGDFDKCSCVLKEAERLQEAGYAYDPLHFNSNSAIRWLNERCQLGFSAPRLGVGWRLAGEPAKWSVDVPGYTRTETTKEFFISDGLGAGTVGSFKFGGSFDAGF